jgi:hypothetical protein
MDGPVRPFCPSPRRDFAFKVYRQILYSPLQVLDLPKTKPEETDALAGGGVVRQPPLEASSEKSLLFWKALYYTLGTENPEAKVDGNCCFERGAELVWEFWEPSESRNDTVSPEFTYVAYSELCVQYEG